MMVRVALLLSFVACIVSISFTLFNSCHNQSNFPVRISLTTRSPVPADEFIKKRLSDEEIDETFLFSPKNATNVNIPESMWSCGNITNSVGSRKLIYAQIPASEGMLVQALLRGYNEYCGASLILVRYCIDIGFEYMHDNETWTNGRTSSHKGQVCRVSTSKSRSGDDWKRFSVNTAFLIDHDVDILGGYLPLGSHHYWTPQLGSHSHETVDAQYVTFLREPLWRWIREAVLLFPEHKSATEIIRVMLEKLQLDTLEGRYRENYSKTLITPAQKEWATQELVDLTYPRRVNMTLQNLAQNPVLVGLVDRLEPSLELLQYLIDRDGKLDNLFSFLVRREETELNVQGLKLVQNVHDELARQPAATKAMVQEYLRYEYEIYRYAVKIHERQYDSWKSMDKRSFASP